MLRKNIFIHKFLLILLLLFLFILIFNSKVFASNYDTNTLPDNILDWISNCSAKFNEIYPRDDNYEGSEYLIFFRDGDINNPDTDFELHIVRLKNFKFVENYNGSFTRVNSHNYYYYEIVYNFGVEEINTKFSFINTGSNYCGELKSANILYSTLETAYFTVNTDENLFNTFNFSISLSTTEKTSEPIRAYSNYFSSENALKYSCLYSDDEGTTWKSMNTQTKTENENIQVRYYINILENGTYCFKCKNKETGKQKIITKTVTNIVFGSDYSDYVKGIPVPHITYKRVSNNFILRTQAFNSEDIKKYTCYYVKVTDDLDMSNINWQDMRLTTATNTILNQTEFYYSVDISVNSENASYLFVFYDNSNKKYGDICTFTADIQSMIEYSEKVSNDLNEKETRLNQLVNFFKERFGFLTYPFEFVSDILKRVLNINYSEPIIKIPELREPFYNYKILDVVEFNFNSLLENNIYLYLHNIYLIAVDFILIFCFIKFSFSVLMGVLSNE